MNRDPNNPNAAERHWILIRALTDLRRSDEAREEARKMVERYRGTEWATDVQRHVLTHPPSPNPAERGE